MLHFPHLAMARPPPPSGVARWRCICGCKTANVRTMNRHMKKHTQWLNIKTTHLMSLTAVFHTKERPRAGCSHPPAAGSTESNHLAPPSGEVDGLGVTPEELALQPNDSGMDDGSGSDDNESSDRIPANSDSDEFKSDDDLGHCEMEEGQRSLEFELWVAKAGNTPS